MCTRILVSEMKFQARHQDEADYKNSDAHQQNSNGQNFAHQHQNSAAEHQCIMTTNLS